MEVNNVAVMRRQKDGWVNATQILKVANIDKGRRTKILEKEIQIGEHEKVQGGYGKYQGTWIPFERGLEVCRQYGVEELLSKLLTHNRGQEGETGNVDTPTKEQAMAAQRKRMYNASSQENRGIGSTGTFFKNISSTASTAVAAINKARFDSPAPRNRSGPSRVPSFNRQSSMQDVADFPNSQQSLVSTEYATQTQNADSGFGSQNTQPLAGDGLEQPPRKRKRVPTPAGSFSGQTPAYDSYNAGNVGNGDPGSPTEPNNSFVYDQVTANDGDASYAAGPLRPLPYDNGPDAEAKRGMLMGLFMDPNGPDESIQAALCNLPPQELDTPIDTKSHTALHWAATLSRMPLLRALITAGANPWRVNASGETALMRACTVTNSMENNTFPELLDLLGCTLDVTDDKGRTVLHHIAVTSAVKGRHYACRYYLESLLEWVVRQGSAPSSQENGIDKKGRRMGIGRFMSEIVNAQDNSGDTALNVAARVGNRSIISQLLEVGADPTIPNRANLKPLDFGIGIADAEPNGDQPGEKNGATAGSGHKSRETSDEVVNCEFFSVSYCCPLLTRTQPSPTSLANPLPFSRMSSKRNKNPSTPSTPNSASPPRKLVTPAAPSSLCKKSSKPSNWPSRRLSTSIAPPRKKSRSSSNSNSAMAGSTSLRPTPGKWNSNRLWRLLRRSRPRDWTQPTAPAYQAQQC